MKKTPPNEPSHFVSHLARETATRDEGAIGIGRRLGEARALLGLTQEGLADLTGGKKRGIQDNEAGKTVPNGRMLQALITNGINVNWLLSGEGPKRISELDRPKPPVDASILVGVIQGVSDALESQGLELEPAKRAELIALLYEQCEAEGVVRPATVLRLVRLAA